MVLVDTQNLKLGCSDSSDPEYLAWARPEYAAMERSTRSYQLENNKRWPGFLLVGSNRCSSMRWQQTPPTGALVQPDHRDISLVNHPVLFIGSQRHDNRLRID